MNREALQKKYNIYILIYLISIFVLIGLIVTRSILLDKGNNLLGVIFFIQAGLFFVVPLVMLIIASRKYRPLIYNAFLKETKSKLAKEEGKSVFITEDGIEVSFKDEFFTYNNIDYEYKDFLNTIVLKNKPKLLTDDVSLLFMMFSSNMNICIPLDGDLIAEIESKGIDIINKKDFKYFLNNTIIAAKQLLRAAAFQATVSYIPLIFAKNEEEKKLKRKVNIKNAVFYIIFIMIILAINILFIWLGESKEGIKISESVTYRLGFKIVFSAIILSLTFIKTKKIKWVGKFLFIIYLIVYWLGILFLPNRINVLILLIFAILFIVVGICNLDKESMKNEPVNRLIGFSMFLMLMSIFITMDYEVVDIGKIAAISGMVTSIITLISIIIVIMYYKKKITDGSTKKKTLVVNAILIPFFVAMFGFLILYCGIQNLNYSLDRSNPILLTEKIIELKKGGENSSDIALVIIEGEKVEIPISTSQYFEFEVGDYIEISLYSGGLGFKYYILEEPKYLQD